MIWRYTGEKARATIWKSGRLTWSWRQDYYLGSWCTGSRGTALTMSGAARKARRSYEQEVA